MIIGTFYIVVLYVITILDGFQYILAEVSCTTLYQNSAK